MIKKEFLKYCNITEDQFSGKEMICGYLDLNSLTSIPRGFSPKIGGSLYLNGLTSIPVGFNPVVLYGDLHLTSLTHIPIGFNPRVGTENKSALLLKMVTSIPKEFNPIVSKLFLNSLLELPENWNPIYPDEIYITDDYKNVKPVLDFINFTF